MLKRFQEVRISKSDPPQIILCESIGKREWKIYFPWGAETVKGMEVFNMIRHVKTSMNDYLVKKAKEEKEKQDEKNKTKHTYTY